MVEQTQLLGLPVIVLGEYRFGIRQSRRREYYEAWLEVLIAQCDVLSVEETTTRHYASVRAELKRKGRPIPANGIWIAALARQHQIPILSRDQHFDHISDVRRIAW